MSVSRTSRRALVALSSVLLTAPLLTIPAAASTAAPVREVVAAASRTAAPTCIAVKLSRSWGAPRATVKNNCSTTRRVKVVWQFAADSSCLITGTGKSKPDTTGLAGSFDGVYNC